MKQESRRAQMNDWSEDYSGTLTMELVREERWREAVEDDSKPHCATTMHSTGDGGIVRWTVQTHCGGCQGERTRNANLTPCQSTPCRKFPLMFANWLEHWHLSLGFITIVLPISHTFHSHPTLSTFWQPPAAWPAHRTHDCRVCVSPPKRGNCNACVVFSGVSPLLADAQTHQEPSNHA